VARPAVDEEGRDVHAERAEASSHEVGGVGTDREVRRSGWAAADEPRHPPRFGAIDDLGLSVRRVERLLEVGGAGGVGSTVEVHEPSVDLGVLEPQRAHEAQQRRRGEGRVFLPDGLGLSGDDEEARRLVAGGERLREGQEAFRERILRPAERRRVEPVVRREVERGQPRHALERAVLALALEGVFDRSRATFGPDQDDVSSTPP
jgi:hypothetical protein